MPTWLDVGVVAFSGLVYCWMCEGVRRVDVLAAMWLEDDPTPRRFVRRHLEQCCLVLLVFLGPCVRPWFRIYIERQVCAFLLAVALAVVLIVVRP